MNKQTTKVFGYSIVMEPIYDGDVFFQLYIFNKISRERLVEWMDATIEVTPEEGSRFDWYHTEYWRLVGMLCLIDGKNPFRIKEVRF